LNDEKNDMMPLFFGFREDVGLFEYPRHGEVLQEWVEEQKKKKKQ
jgi:hypothetical protein